MIELEDLGDNLRLYKGDCRRLIASLPDNSVDSVVTDPPYEIGFMNRSFDSTGIAFDVDLWKDILRVLKPGGHVAAFAASRTYHRLACAIEDAGFEIRDQIDWVYASGMPHGSDATLMIDRERRDYNRYYAGRDWEKPENYDLLINTTQIGVDGSVQLIKDYLKMRGLL